MPLGRVAAADLCIIETFMTPFSSILVLNGEVCGHFGGRKKEKRRAEPAAFGAIHLMILK